MISCWEGIKGRNCSIVDARRLVVQILTTFDNRSSNIEGIIDAAL